MKIFGTNILVEQDNNENKFNGKVIFDHSKEYTINAGIVKLISDGCPDDININVGDFVYFSNEAGVYIDKKMFGKLMLLDYREIVCVSKDMNNNILIGEDMRYYLEEDLANNRLNRVASH